MKKSEVINTLTFRAIASTDIDNIVKLFNDVFSGDVNEKHLEQKYFNNAYGDVIAIGAFHNEKLIGFYGVIPCKLKLQKTIVSAGQSVDTMVHPEYQGMGLFVKLANLTIDLCSERGLYCLYGLPNANSLPGFTRSLGWVDIGKIQFLFKPLYIRNISRIPSVILAFIQFIIDLILPRSVVYNEVEVADDIDWAVIHGRTVTGISVVKDKEWYQWRYAKALDAKYVLIRIEDPKGNECGAIVGRRGETSFISEIICKSEDSVSSIIRAVEFSERKRKAKKLYVMSSDERSVKSYRKQLYIPKGRLSIIVRPIGHESSPINLYDQNNWKLFGSDSDTL